MEKKRLTAVKTKISPITGGKFVVQEGFNPNYILTKSGANLSRVRILATIVDKFASESGKFASITIDDGTDTIRAKAFNAVSMFDDLNIGDTIDIFSRIKEYQNEIYLVPEVIVKIDDPNFELLRELEINSSEKNISEKREKVLEYKKQTADLNELKKIMKERFGIEENETEAILSSSENDEEDKDTDKDLRDSILKLIVENDKGDGCDYSLIIEKAGIEEEKIDTIINSILEDGVCFEPRPGKIKKL